MDKFEIEIVENGYVLKRMSQRETYSKVYTAVEKHISQDSKHLGKTVKDVVGKYVVKKRKNNVEEMRVMNKLRAGLNARKLIHGRSMPKPVEEIKLPKEEE